MITQRLRCRPSLAAVYGIVLGVVACGDGPTGVPIRPSSQSSQSLNAGSFVGPKTICYLIDGQVYCVGGTLASSNSTQP